MGSLQKLYSGFPCKEPVRDFLPSPVFGRVLGVSFGWLSKYF